MRVQKKSRGTTFIAPAVKRRAHRADLGLFLRDRRALRVWLRDAMGAEGRFSTSASGRLEDMHGRRPVIRVSAIVREEMQPWSHKFAGIGYRNMAWNLERRDQSAVAWKNDLKS